MTVAKIGERAGAGLSEGHGSKQQASDRELFLALREELSAIKTASAVTTADATDLATAVALVNDLKSALNSIAAIVDRFEA
jgi:hypothetical protein